MMMDFFMLYFPNVMKIQSEIWTSTLETLYMTFITALIGGIAGILIGVVLVVTQPRGILQNRILYSILDKIINLMRSIPFIILMTLLVPVTRFVFKTSIGTTAALIPLTAGITPFYARQIQNALLEVNPGVIEAAQAMGSSPFEIIFHVYLKEALPGIIRVSAVTFINLIGLTTMAGAIGAGGLGNLAIARGYNRFQNDVTLVSTAILLVIVFISQAISDVLVEKTSH